MSMAGSTAIEELLEEIERLKTAELASYPPATVAVRKAACYPQSPVNTKEIIKKEKKKGKNEKGHNADDISLCLTLFRPTTNTHNLRAFLRQALRCSCKILKPLLQCRWFEHSNPYRSHFFYQFYKYLAIDNNGGQFKAAALNNKKRKEEEEEEEE